MGLKCSKLNIFGTQEFRILIQGLDAAGKTTVLYWLKLGEVVTTIPTIGFNVESIKHKNISFTCWDVGGRDKIRPLLRHYYPNTQALIYVVDSVDTERMEDVKEEMQRVLMEDDLRDVPLLVLANKQDLPKAVSVDKVKEYLKLNEIKSHPWQIIPTTATTGEGLLEALDWVSQAIKTSEKGHLTFESEEEQDPHSGSSYLYKGYEYIKKILTT